MFFFSNTDKNHRPLLTGLQHPKRSETWSDEQQRWCCRTSGGFPRPRVIVHFGPYYLGPFGEYVFFFKRAEVLGLGHWALLDQYLLDPFGEYLFYLF